MAAPLGYKDFTTGEVLTANDVDGYLMQGIWVFASAAARDAAVTSPQEGNFAFLKDTNLTTYYTGSAWANLDTTGMVNPMTTTGDTIYSSSGSTPARLGIGTTGQVLTVASGIPSWATPTSGGMTLLASGSMSGSQVSITGLSGSYETLVCYVISPTNSNAENFCVRLNNDTGSNYAYTGTSARLTTTFQSQSSTSILNDFPVIPASGATQGWQLTIQNYTAGNYKTVSIVGAGLNSPGTKHVMNNTGMWASTSAVTEIDLFPAVGTWSAGTYEVFGVK